MLKILSIKYRKEKILYSYTPGNLYINNDRIDSFILYHRRIASEMFGDNTSVIIDHREKPEIIISSIQVFKLVAEKTGVEQESLLSKSRIRDVVEARQIAIKICNEDLYIQPGQLEKETNITHDNQWYARQTIQGLIDSYNSYEIKYNDIRDYVLGKIFNNHGKGYKKQSAAAI